MAPIVKMNKALLVICFAGLMVTGLQAAHIIGGVISYECLGSGQYRFTLRLYRDCNGGGAPFDSAPGSQLTGTVSIFRGTSSAEFTKVLLNAPKISMVLPNLSNPCLIAPDVCVQEGVYTFTVNLPISAESYHIVYQRCCRNNTITNIFSPGQTGATYYIELTAEAQATCNNSPVFKEFPPIVICNGVPIDFDHSAVDADGDSLVYEMCTPFDGGGPNQTNATSPGGVAPDPDLPPPYLPVTFIAPTYSWTNPLAANPSVIINAATGFLTGTPLVQGQFVVGVCVREYRNGQLLSLTRRDFQFNVAQCNPTVVAAIDHDSVTVQQGKEFHVVRSCGNTFQFTNLSYQSQFINQYRWVFVIADSVHTFTQWNATVQFPEPGTYFGNLILNPGTSCGDTLNIKVNVFPEINAEFSMAYDTCVAGPVLFTDASATGAPDGITKWTWNFGDGIISNQQNPQHIYKEPGSIPVRLCVTDTNFCEAEKLRNLAYFPVPPVLIVAPSALVACQPATIFFDNLSSPINEEYTIRWNFGDGGTSTEISPTHVYINSGVYDVSLEVVSPLGCQIDTFWPDLITVLPSPIADFTFSPSRPSNIEPTLQFTDLSINAVKWRWVFDAFGTSIQQNPVFTFQDTGVHEVRLVVFHPSGCPDTAIQFIDIVPEVRYHLPNAFTPDGDGINDLFKGKGLLEGARDFYFVIFNRYGERIFETTDPGEGWNGRKHNVGDISPAGVYVVVVTFSDPRGQPMEFRGFATLVK